MNEARILLVDDDAALLEALPQAILLRMNGITIDTAQSAEDAIERIQEVDYDAVVTDIKMPRMDGLALMGEIEKLRPGTPTLLITGHGEHDLAVQALRGGAYDFVAKPIDRDYFIASLERAIQMRRLDREVDRQRIALQRHARVLEHVDDGVFLVDPEGILLHWNPAAAAITGLPPSTVLGRAADDVLPGWSAAGPTVPVAAEPGPGSTDARTLPFEIDGREIWLSISGVAFEDGVVYAFRNLTEERALDELKGEFVATVSHELRTPLAAIYGSAQTLLRRDIDLDDEKRRRLLEVIGQESERLSRVAADILLANNLDSGRLHLEQHRLDIARLAQEVVEGIRPLVADRDDLSIEVAVPAARSFVAGDEDKLRQVLINLVDNAVKYSPQGGAIEVRVEPDSTNVNVSVEDHGLGIPPAEQQRIFGKFYRVDPQLSRGVGGTGLGLYICRELVRRMDGRLSVTSREGEGSTFLVELPLVASQAVEPPEAVPQPA
jgi:PAS domain S-box-containing protein